MHYFGRYGQKTLKFAQKYEVKVIASNNVFYLNKSDANAHDILLCVKDGALQSTPKGKGRGYRSALPNEEYYFKSQDQMKEFLKIADDRIKMGHRKFIDK